MPNEKLFLYFLLILFLNAVGCSEKIKEIPLSIENYKVLDSIPSGSGIVVKNDTAYIVGDDATGVYQLNLKNLSQLKIPISGLTYDQYREPKPVKHDFESATFINWNGKQYLLAIGSGSNLNTRDSLLLFNISENKDQRIVSLHNFYVELLHLTSTDSTQWNVEGATVIVDDLILLNRGNNLIIRLDLKDFLNYLFYPDSSFPKLSFNQIKLPTIDDKEARLSGACTLNDSQILFCASVEDTPDWTKDGPVLGSYIGIYSVKENQLIRSYLLKNKQGQVLKEKIESLDILEGPDKNIISLIAIGDNDNGSSKIFNLKMGITNTE